MSGPSSSTPGSAPIDLAQIELTLLRAAAEYSAVVSDLLKIWESLQEDSYHASTYQADVPSATDSFSTHDDLGNDRPVSDDGSGRLF